MHERLGLDVDSYNKLERFTICNKAFVEGQRLLNEGKRFITYSDVNKKPLINNADAQIIRAIGYGVAALYRNLIQPIAIENGEAVRDSDGNLVKLSIDEYIHRDLLYLIENQKFKMEEGKQRTLLSQEEIAIKKI